MSVPGSWLGPVMERFQEIADAIDENPRGLAFKLQRLIDTIPDLYVAMDHDTLSDTIEKALGAATLSGAMNSKGADIITGLSSDDYESGAAFMPFDEAAAALDRRTPIGSKLNSLQWRGTPAELRNRAMLSSRVESIRFLSESRNRLAAELRLQREQLANGEQAFFSRDNFISEMRKIAEAEGVDTNDGDFDGSIRDIRSAQRLGLIYDINTEQAENHARYKMDLDPDVLDAYPAKRLVRLEDREHKRNWIEIWRAAANEVDWDGVAGGDDMVALKTSPIWTRLGPFGNPYPPYDWGSGMGDEDVSREEAESIGLLEAGEDVPTPDETENFNARMEMGIDGDTGDLLDRLQEDFGDQVQMDKGRVRWQGNMITDLYDKVLKQGSNGNKSGTKINFGVASPDAISKSAAVMDISGLKMHLHYDDVQHMISQHSDEKRKSQRNITKSDIEMLPYVWRNPDSVEKGNKNNSLVFKKKIMGETHLVAWQMHDREKIMWPNSAWVVEN